MATAAPSVEIRVLVDFFEKSMATSLPVSESLSFQSVHRVGLLNLCLEAFNTSWENSSGVRSLVDRRCRGDDRTDCPVYGRPCIRVAFRSAEVTSLAGAILKILIELSSSTQDRRCAFPSDQRFQDTYFRAINFRYILNANSKEHVWSDKPFLSLCLHASRSTMPN